MTARVLVAGIGNVFLGDDGFGVEVARRLLAEPAPPGVTVVDVGIRALHLAYELLDQPQLLLIVDAVSRGGPPGTLYLIDLEGSDTPGCAAPGGAAGFADAHSMSVSTVFAALGTLGGVTPRTRLVGCEPAFVGEDMGLSAAVAAAVPQALAMVRKAIKEEMRDETTHRLESVGQPQA
jgi:hydrogenase maturation protease